MIIGVFGPRELSRGVPYKNYNQVADILEGYAITTLISGGGAGVERLALRFAEENGIESRVVPPHIQALGTKAAFERRNETIIQAMHIGVILWDGKERFYSELIAKIIQSGKLANVHPIS